LIDEVPYRELTSALVTQRLGLSPSAFYRYFGDINDAVLELTGAMGETADSIAGLVERSDWNGRDGRESGLAVVDAMGQFWSEHRALYRVTELCADEGDKRFADVKASTFAGLTAAVEAAIARFKRAGAHDRKVDPYAAACVVVTMVIHTVARESAFDIAGVRAPMLRAHLARQLRAGITGEMPAV
jgi:AcrR family transcriptional regulator